MPYIANHRVDAGDEVYEPGAEVPGDIVDEAMVEAGSVSLVDHIEAGPYDKLDRKELFALCAAREIETNPRLKKDELKALLVAFDSGSTVVDHTDAGDTTDGGDGDQSGDVDQSGDTTDGGE